MDGIIYINKEMGYTSMDVCAKIRKILHTKHVGQTGTLDPNATGILTVLLGKSCKLSQFLLSTNKEYIAEIKLGIKTNTGDIWGDIIESKHYIMPNIEEVNAVLKSFIGKQTQIPPMTSAIKINGQKLYELQRKGIEIERKPRNIEIFDIELLEFKDTIKYRVVVSSGTYIRTLSEDIAERLNTIGTMASLVRSRVGEIGLDDCVKISDVESGNYILHDSLSAIKGHYPIVEVSDIKDIKNGKKIKLNCENKLVMLTFNNELVACYELKEDGFYHSKRGLW